MRPMDAAMSTWTSSDSLVNTASYDTDGRLTAISVPGVQSLGFAYDTADRVTEVGNGIQPGYTQNFGYDAMSHLVSVYSSTDSESFQYDANGNRLAQTGVLNTYSATSNRLVSSGGTQYGYDAQGNTTIVTMGIGITMRSWGGMWRVTRLGWVVGLIRMLMSAITRFH